MERSSFDFSKVAKVYAQFRPAYPPELFTYLANLVRKRERAWDCATGSGQCAHGLAPFFQQVVATDLSPLQIAHAKRHPKISFLVGPAEKTDFPAHTVDLVTVAQAVHWFDLDRFFREVRRVLRPGGVVALWCYERIWTDNPEIDALLEEYAKGIVGPYWPKETHWVWAQYKTLPFPFREIQAPAWMTSLATDLDGVIGYLQSWSATHLYAEATGRDPLNLIQNRLEKAWGPVATIRNLNWRLHLRVGFAE